MMPSSPASISLGHFQSLVGYIYSRRLLLHTPLHKEPPQWTATGATPPILNVSGDNPKSAAGSTMTPESTFDANVVMVLALLLCALICALGLNSIVRCALRCSHRVAGSSAEGTEARFDNTGVKRKALRTVPTVTYPSGLKLSGSSSECAICISEFVTGERLRVLPKCNHGFHARCIDPWLMARSSCPICRQCLFNTCQKIPGCAEVDRRAPPPLPQLVIVPLEHVGLVRGH